MGTETVTVEVFNGTDDFGTPSYTSGQDIEARAVRDVTVTMDQDEQQVETDLTVIVDADQSPLPDKEDRLTVGSNTYIVDSRKDGEDLSGTLQHVIVMAREE